MGNKVQERKAQERIVVTLISDAAELVQLAIEKRQAEHDVSMLKARLADAQERYEKALGELNAAIDREIERRVDAQE